MIFAIGLLALVMWGIYDTVSKTMRNMDPANPRYYRDDFHEWEREFIRVD